MNCGRRFYIHEEQRLAYVDTHYACTYDCVKSYKAPEGFVGSIRYPKTYVGPYYHQESFKYNQERAWEEPLTWCGYWYRTELEWTLE